jgi:cytochrome P450
VHDFIAYLETLIERRRASPGEPDRDVLTRLIQGEDAGERLSPPEAAAQLHLPAQRRPRDDDQPDRQRLVALAPHPEQKARLLAEPALVAPAVEEILRYESSNQLGNRITTGAVEVGGVALAPRTQITLAIGAANRDPDKFADPERFDIGRTQNRHLAFGSGIHQCAGMRSRASKGPSRSGASSAASALRVDRRAGARRPCPLRGFLKVPCAVEPDR